MKYIKDWFYYNVFAYGFVVEKIKEVEGSKFYLVLKEHQEFSRPFYIDICLGIPSLMEKEAVTDEILLMVVDEAKKSVAKMKEKVEKSFEIIKVWRG